MPGSCVCITHYLSHINYISPNGSKRLGLNIRIYYVFLFPDVRQSVSEQRDILTDNTDHNNSQHNSLRTPSDRDIH